MPLHVKVPEIAAQSSFSPDLLTDTGLAVSPPALPLPVNHSLEGVSVQSPPSYSSASSLALLLCPRVGPSLRFSILRGLFPARPPVGGLASRSGSPAAASGEPLLGPQQEPTARRHSLPLATSGSAPSPSPIDLGLPASQVSARAPLQVTLILILPCFRGLCCSVQGYPPKAFCVVLPLAFSWICFLVLKNLLVLQFCLSTIQLCRLTSCWIPVWTS